jgi:hypothetical protein
VDSAGLDFLKKGNVSLYFVIILKASPKPGCVLSVHIPRLPGFAKLSHYLAVLSAFNVWFKYSG